MKHYKDLYISEPISISREQRRNGMRGLAHVIAGKLRQLCVPYLNRGDEPPPEFLARIFEDGIRTARIRGGPLSHEEATALLHILVPRALAKMPDGVPASETLSVAA